jgi:hypothetical protein
MKTLWMKPIIAAVVPAKSASAPKIVYNSFEAGATAYQVGPNS